MNSAATYSKFHYRVSGIRANAALAAGALMLAAVSLLFIAPSAGAAGASVTLKKDSNGLFLLTINDSDGIKAFSLQPATQGPYGGEIPKCPRTFQSSNVLFTDPADFKPFMPASITDCRGNTDELEIPPPEAGATKSKRPKPPAPPPAPALTPAPTPPSAAETAAPASEQDRREHAATEAAKAKVSYPVAELGDCGSEAACQAYCEDLANVKACVAYAEAHGLITAAEAAEGRKFAEIGGKGPGGCTSRESCAAYCEDVSRIEECLDFAEKNDFLSGKELEEVRAVAKVKREGVAFPGGCTSKAACEAYCGEASHIDECLAFAERSGLIPPDELVMARKMLPLIKEGKTPGGCTRKEACEAYCQQPANMRACLVFAEEQGLIPPEELEMAKKFLPLMEKGETPGGCRSKETCEAYCGEEGHMDECIEFGIKSGFISEADAELARKTGGKGPGDCKSKEACEKFCEQPENLETCTTFAREHGLEVGGPGGCEDIEECRTYCEDPAHQDECGGFAKDRGLSITGPGGCQGRDQCTAYCTDLAHQDECEPFLKDQGIEFSGPGGCASFEECEDYCRTPEHLPECQGFTGGQGGGPGGGPGGANGFPGGGGGEEGKFSDCITKGMAAAYVCGVNGKHAPPGVETTYFNACHAKQHGVEILHEGLCKGQAPCSDIADPVCGNDGNTWVGACYAEQQGGGVRHEGVCENQSGSGGGSPPPGGTPPPPSGGSQNRGPGGGPGGCRSDEECRAYCQTNYTDPACGGSGGTPAPPPPPPPPSTQSCAPLPSGLVSWLDDDTLSGGGGVTLAPGKVGKALQFDGAGGHVNDGNPASLNFGTGPFSLEAWFLWDGGGSSKGNIIRKANYPVSGDGAGYWLVIGKDNGTLEFFAGETVGNPEKSRGRISTPIRSGAWYHVVATRDGAGIMSLYVDGQLAGTAEAAGADTTSGAPFTLGAWDDRFGITEFFSGLIDEASVYNRALTPGEVRAIFSAGGAGKCSATSSADSDRSQPQIDCSPFAQVPQCSYVGPEGSPNYNYCKQCFPAKAREPSSLAPATQSLGLILAPFVEFFH